MARTDETTAPENVGGPTGGTGPPTGAAGALAALDPAYFGLVMSTGVVSLAFLELGVGVVAWPLAALNAACYAALVGLFGARTALFPGRTVADLRDRERHWGALTFAVATATVGTQALAFLGAVAAAAALWAVAVAVTPALLYYLFGTEVVGAGKAAVSERVDGAFLLVVVCMQALAVLGAPLSRALPEAGETVLLASVGYFGAGYLLYVVVATVVTYRLLEGRMRPPDWTGPYWILMGAAAITTLAGARLGPVLEATPAWEPYAPVVLGVTFLAWALSTWWIPLLVVLDGWKFLTGGVDGRPPAWVLALPWARLAFGNRLHEYAPTAWGRVFPMGMYTAATLTLGGVATFGPLAVVPAYWGWFALLVWALTLVGTGRAVARVFFERVAPADAG